MVKIADSHLFFELKAVLHGELYYEQTAKDLAMLRLYSTDASVYQEMPIAVAIPVDIQDLKHLISFAQKQKHTLIPRTAGTSLAGQVVGNGIIVDFSQHFNQIIELNVKEKWVIVQPGNIRNDLNTFLKPHQLFFGPETSTANRAMIGGMIGNNSCGLHSIVWGDTRQNIIELEVLLSDGSQHTLDKNTLVNGSSNPLLNSIVQQLSALLSDDANQKAIEEGFPAASISRRNTGYALDLLMKSRNICDLIAGSEGTLCMITSAKLKLLDSPLPHVGLVNVHCNSMRESLLANLVALSQACFASEIMDDVTLEFTKDNVEQQKNRAFVEGTPKSILMVEFFAENMVSLNTKIDNFIVELKSKNLGYSYPVLYGEETNNAWDLRKAALGLLSHQKGDFQPTNLIEDCAVTPADLPDYIDEIENLLKSHNLKYAISAHAGAGELHVIPMMNLKTEDGRVLFKHILTQTAAVVKKYKGSLSGEHGDGRLRGEFLPFMLGQHTYGLFLEVKKMFDPAGVFNVGKITDTPAMNEFLRVQMPVEDKIKETVFDFSEQGGILTLAEKCGGSGDCRKTHITGGTMCPSYMATRNEKDSTRARANILRHYYSEPTDILKEGAKEVLDLCLSCKACKAECPSSVDVGKMKAEFTQEYYDKYGSSFRSKLIANFSSLMKLASMAPQLYNFIYKNKFLSAWANKIVGFHPDRSMPLLSNQTFWEWYKNHNSSIISDKKVIVFIDEFTNYNDAMTGIKLIKLIEKLGFEAIVPKLKDSGRSYLSKGFVRQAKNLVNLNLGLLEPIISENAYPIIGVEPSAILGFRDEYLDLADTKWKAVAQKVAERTLLFEEWFERLIDTKEVKKEQFSSASKKLKLHGHCHQKALSSMVSAKKTLSFPQNYTVELIPSGCCGMAGSYGYEREHFDISKQIASLVLLPTLQSLDEAVVISASGTSCRHQIKDFAHKIAYHPIEILYDALI